MIKVMPHNIEAEQALLGSLMLYERSIAIATEEALEVDSFYLQAHRSIFQAMEMLHLDQKPTDIISVQAKLSDLGLLSNVGDIDYLIQIQEASVTSANTKHYIEIIQNKAFARRLIEAANEIAEEGYGSTFELNDFMDTAEKKVLDITRNRKTGDFRAGKEVINEVFEKICEMRNNNTSITGIKTGYKSLDARTNGLQRGDLIIVAARPSVGKTAFALNLALKAAKHNRDEAIAIFSLEMPAEHLVTRMLAVDSGVPGATLKTGNFRNDEEQNMLNNSVQKMTQLQLYIDDSSMLRTSEIFSKCRRLKAEQGLALVVIDYIQLLSGSNRSKENRQQEVSEISRNLKALARELEVPVVALSQLSRGVEARTDKRPLLSDLRESGSLEQDADIVMLLYREEYHTAHGQENDNQEVEVIMAKHRNGATGTITMMFEKSINAFRDVEKKYE